MNMNGMNAQGQTFTYIILDRPFKCTINCVFCVINPQELTVKNGAQMVIGRVVQDWVFLFYFLLCTDREAQYKVFSFKFTALLSGTLLSGSHILV